MDMSLFVATRYLKTHPENRFVSWISTLSILGIAIGVGAMIVVLSVINGFETELRERFLAANAHVMGYRFPGGIKDYALWEKQILEDYPKDVKSIAPFIYTESMIRKDYLVHPVIIKGILPLKREHVQSLKNYVLPQIALQRLQDEMDDQLISQEQKPGMILGSQLAKELGVKLGDTVEVVSAGSSDQDSFDEMISYEVYGLYDSGLQHYDQKLALISLKAGQKLLNLKDSNTVTGLEMGLNNPQDSPKIAKKMTSQYRLTIKEWQSYNKNVFNALRNERNVIGLIVALVAFVASFNILTTLFISVTQKRRDIALMKALGASNTQILQIFIKQSLLIGLLGCCFGLLGGALLSKCIESIPFIDLPNIYLVNRLPVDYDPMVYLSAAIGSLLIAGIAGIYPAFSATRTPISEGLKDIGDHG